MEQFSLRWEHVDLDRRLITFPKTKSGSVQYVRLNQEAIDLLREVGDLATKRHAVAEAEAIASKETGTPIRSPWVFPSENPATHVDPRNFYRRVYLPTVKAKGLDGVSGHTLRHTFASRLAMSGAREGTIAELLRHSGTTLVKRYAHLSDTYLRSEVEKVAVFRKAEARSIVDKVAVAGESKSAGAEIEKSAKVEPHQAELAGTVTGTVTGLTR